MDERVSESKIPSRWRAPSKELLLPMPPVLERILGVNIREDDPRITALRDALLESDPLADAVVEWMHQQPAGQGRALFERALTQGLAQVPTKIPALEALFASLETEPVWLDRSMVQAATNTLLRVGRGGYYALSCVSLMSGYLSSGAVKPLAMTGALTRMAPRRIAETGKFSWDLATSGRLERSSAGFHTTVRVRMMHATVRHSLLRSGRWNTDAWGLPINQRDMVGTHLEFTVAYIGGLTALGFLLSKDEREAIMHFWRYVGFLLGTRDELLPTNFHEGLEVAKIFNSTETGPDEDGKALARALIAVLRAGGPEGRAGTLARIEGEYLVGFSRFALGRLAADRLGIPDTKWKYAPLVTAPVLGSIELLRTLVPGGRSLAVRVGRRMSQRQVDASLQGKEPTFVPSAMPQRG